MKHARKIIALLLALTMIMALTVSAAASGEKKKFTIANVVTEDTSFGDLTDAMEEVLEGSGLFDVEVYPNASLVTDSEGVQAVEAGTITLYISTCGSFAPYASPFFVYDKMFGFDDVRVGRAVAQDEELHEALNKEIEQFNMRLLGMSDMGFRKLTASKLVQSKDDMDGVKLRVMENPIYVAAWKALGINPTPVAYTEIYSALQQGVIQAQENPVELCYATKVYEAQKYIIDTNHLFHNLPIVINLDYWNNLTDEEKAIVEEAVAKGVEAAQAATDEYSEKFYEVFAEAGCEHVDFPAEAREELASYMTESWSEIEARVTPEMWQAYNDAIERAEASIK